MVKAGNVAPKSRYFSDSGNPFVRAGSLSALVAGNPTSSLEKIAPDIAQDLGMRLFPKGTVLFAKSGMSCMTGNVYRLPEPCYVVSHLACVTTEDELLSQWLLHFFRYNRPSSLIENPSFPSIKLSRLSSIEVILPNQKEMLREVQALSAIEEQNELYKEQMKKLDQLIKSRFVEMFGDPNENPIGWRKESLLTLGECKNGLNYRADDSGYTVLNLGVADFKDRAFLMDMSLLSSVSISEKPKDSYLLKDGDLLFVRSNGNKELVGRCLAVYPGEREVIFSGFCIRLRLHDESVRTPFLLWTLKQPSMRRQMFGRGANVQNLNQEILGNVRVPIPPLAKQDEFLSFVDEVDKSRFVVQQQIEKLKTLYDSLAQEYFGD